MFTCHTCHGTDLQYAERFRFIVVNSSFSFDKKLTTYPSYLPLVIKHFMPQVRSKIPEEKMRFGVLTVSDTCFTQENVDKSGPQIKALIKARYTERFVIYEDIVPDELEKIKDKLIEWSDDMCDVVFTTGGTGIAERDVTPEATKAVIEKEVPGISFVMMSKSLASTPFAMLSRATSGIRKKTLIINFPGSVKAVTENFEAICDIIPHAVSLLQNMSADIQKIHSKLANLPLLQPKPNSFSTSLPHILAPSNVLINTVANRPRTSPYKMVSVDNALGYITMNYGRTSDTEFLPIVLPNIMGRVLAEDVRSCDALPPFAASIKDGYAVKSSDGAGLRTVVNVRAAGDNPQTQELLSGQCIRISTGAPVPPGANAVVQVEDTELVRASEDSSKELQINIKVDPKTGQDIRQIGSDIPAHSIVLQKGHVLNAAEVGVLAAVGQNKVHVFKPRTNHKRSNLNKESKDVVKNVIFYFDQQKNAGGFLFPIEKPTEAAAAATGLARSTVIKMRKEIKGERSSTFNKVSEVSEIDDYDDIENNVNENVIENNQIKDNNYQTDKTETKKKKMKRRIKKPREIKHRKIRKHKFSKKQKDVKTELKSPKIKITTDGFTGTKPGGSTVIEIQGKKSTGGLKRLSAGIDNHEAKRIRLIAKKEDKVDILNEQIKIISNELVDTSIKSEIKTERSPVVKRIVVNCKNNEIISESQSKLSSRPGTRSQVKRIRIEATKNDFLTESTAKLAAAVGIDQKTIQLIKNQVLNSKLTNKSFTVSDKDSSKIKIIKSAKDAPKQTSTDFKIITKESLNTFRAKSPKINIIKNQLIQEPNSPGPVTPNITIKKECADNSPNSPAGNVVLGSKDNLLNLPPVIVKIPENNSSPKPRTTSVHIPGNKDSSPKPGTINVQILDNKDFIASPTSLYAQMPENKDSLPKPRSVSVQLTKNKNSSPISRTVNVQIIENKDCLLKRRKGNIHAPRSKVSLPEPPTKDVTITEIHNSSPVYVQKSEENSPKQATVNLRKPQSNNKSPIPVTVQMSKSTDSSPKRRTVNVKIQKNTFQSVFNSVVSKQQNVAEIIEMNNAAPNKITVKDCLIEAIESNAVEI